MCEGGRYTRLGLLAITRPVEYGYANPDETNVRAGVIDPFRKSDTYKETFRIRIERREKNGIIRPCLRNMICGPILILRSGHDENPLVSERAYSTILVHIGPLLRAYVTASKT